MIRRSTFPTIIAEGNHLQGSVELSSGAEIFGSVEGDILHESLEELVIGISGWVSGSIISQGPILIRGRVHGNLHSGTRVILTSTAEVRGDVEAPSVTIFAGALINGKLLVVARGEAKPQNAAA